MDRRDTARAFGWSVIFSALNRVILPLATVVFSRLLGPEAMGVYYIAFNVMVVAEVFRDAGLSQTYIADPNVEGDRERVYNLLGVISGVLPAAALLVVSPWLGPALNLGDGQGWVLWVIAGILALNGFLTIPSARLQRENRFRELGLAEAIASVASYALAFLGVFLGWGVPALIGMLVLRAALNVALMLRYVPWQGALADRGLIREILGKSKSVLGSMLMGIPFGMMDSLLVAGTLGKEASGYYGNARSLALKPAELISFPLGRTLYVAYSKRVGDVAQFADVYVRSLTVSALFVVPVYLFLWSFSAEIIIPLLGERWAPTVPLFAILCIYFGVRSLGTLGGSALTAAGKASATFPCWALAYLAVAAMLAARWQTLDTEWVAWSFLGGAIGVYGSMTLTALWTFRASRAALVRFGQSLGLGALQLALLMALERSGLPLPVQVSIAFLGLPVIHLLLAGALFERRPRAFLSLKGLKYLYRTL